MIAWLLAATLPLSTFPPRLVGADPRYGPTCAAGQTVLNASTSIDAAIFTASLQLRLVTRHASESDRAVQYAQTAMRRATMLNEQMQQTLAIPALVRADPPTLAQGDNLGQTLAALIPPQQAGIAAVRAYADEVQREPRLPHGAGWSRVQRARGVARCDRGRPPAVLRRLWLAEVTVRSPGSRWRTRCSSTRGVPTAARPGSSASAPS